LPSYRVVLVEPSFEESIGFVARAMKNFGLDSFHIVKPSAKLGPNGRMRGAHAQDVLDSIVVHDSLLEALDGLDLSVATTAQTARSSTNLLRKPMTPADLGKSIARMSGHVGIVFGREGTGLNNHELSLCDAIVTIPAADSYPTLNLSHAASIIFYELTKARLSVPRMDLASEEVKRTILAFLSELLDKAGLEEYKIGLTVRALKSIMGRSAIRRREAGLLAGGLREIAASTSRTVGSNASEVSSEEQVRLLLEE
jgi:tRNA/rRNA methyltransferase